MNIIKKVFYGLCNNTASPVSLGLWFRYCYAPEELAVATINPLDYNDPVSFSVDYACVSFLRKYEGLDTGIDTKSEALQKFRKAEEKCERMNRDLWVARTTGRLGQTETAILLRAQELMRSIWGSPTFSDLFDRCGWGPGSTSSLKGGTASREHKMSQYPVSITPGAKPYFAQLISHDVLWLRHLLKQDVVGDTCLLDCCFELTSSSRLLTVPKDARSDRTICAEPTGNCYLQKGFGSYIRSRLRRFGIDLDDQTLNQRLAQRAYSEGLATLDLKSASDTISIGVVRLLCPSDMFELLNNLRSPAYGTEKGETRFHKFSSMGNGFTFELESAIFYCLVRAVKDVEMSESPIGIYGDDIICGREIANKVVAVLNDCGFELNAEKSFLEGPFFESCGKHYFKGSDVTPVFQKALVDNDLEYIRCHNRLFDWVERCTTWSPYYTPMKHLVTAVLRARPSTLKKVDCFGFPWYEGDGFFKVDKPKMPYHPLRGYKLTYLQARKPKRISADGGLYADCVRLAHFKQSSADVLKPDSLSPTLGYCDIRPSGRVKEYRTRTRWVPSCFGSTDSLAG